MHSHNDNSAHHNCHCHNGCDELHHEHSHEQCHADHHHCQCHSHCEQKCHSDSQDCCNHKHHETHSCGCGHEHHKKSKNDLIRFLVSAIFFVMSFIPFDIEYLQIVFKSVSIILCGYKILIHGLSSLFKIKFDENTLMAIAAIAAAVMGDLNESYMIVVLFSIGEYMEEYALSKSHKRIEKLIDLTDDYTFDEAGNKIDAENIKTGDVFVVHPGDKVCTDCTIIKGNTSFDTSAITGESLPQDTVEGTDILSGYINLGTSVVCKATTNYSNSTTSRIKEYIKNASAKKSTREKFITKFASIYTPVVIICAVILTILLALLGITSITEAIKRGLTFMIASCPCALVISIPLSYFAAVGAAGKKGILVKGSVHIDTIAKADAIVFDKTGTITDGIINVESVTSKGNLTAEEIMAYAKALEINSSHPIARGICRYPTSVEYIASQVKEHFGKGIEGIIEDKKVYLGKIDTLLSDNCDTEEGLVLTIDGNTEAVIKLNDTIKPDTSAIFEELYKNGINKISIFSGDSHKRAQAISSQLPYTDAKGDMLPRDKAKAIDELKENHTVVFVGDGVNDAPALTAADFSVAVGNGSSLALEAGDATLMSNTLKPLLSLRKLATHTVATVYFNIVFSLLVKVVVLLLSVFGLAPIWLALLSDVGVLIVAVLNSMSILYRQY